MAKTVQYWGTVNYQELPLTGRLVTWTPKQKQEVPDAIATLLLAAGVGFLLDNDNNGELAVYATDSSGNVTGLVGPGGGVIPFYGTSVCLLGDSIAEQNTSVIVSGSNFRQQGLLSWALSYLGWPWDFQPTDNFAVAGSGLDVIISSQLPLLLLSHTSRKYTRCFISAGTNDTNSGVAFATIQSRYLSLFGSLRSVGIIPVMWGILPRGNDAAVTNPKLQNMALNQWLYQMSLTGLIEFIDCTEQVADNTTAFGNCIASLMYDSVLHPNGRGANLIGKSIAAYYISGGVQPQLQFATQQSDSFERTYNPNGVAFLSANPLMQGGTTAPTGMTTSGGTWSKSTRLLVNGQSRSDPTVAALASSTLHYLYDDWTKTGQWGATDLQPGDVIEGRAKIIIASGANINYVELKLNENDGTTQKSYFCLSNDNTSIIDGNHTLYLKTPKCTISAYSGSGNVSIFLQLRLQTLAAASGSITVQGFEVRKVA